MLNASRSLRLNIKGAAERPAIPELADLSRYPVRFTKDQLVMIAGQSGSGKSTLAQFIVSRWNLPTLYFSADMSAYDTAVKMACITLNKTSEEIQEELQDEERRKRIYDALDKLNVTFSYGDITWRGIEAELDAYVEVFNSYPEVIVVDNLMDIEGCDADYAAQQEAMQFLHSLKNQTECTLIILHHASDKAESDNGSYEPQSRKAIKNGMSEKPDIVLTVGLNPVKSEFYIAPVKNRRGRSDKTGNDCVKLRAIPERGQFERKSQGMKLV